MSLYIHDDDGTECKDIESCQRLNSRHVWSSSALQPDEVNRRLWHALYLAEKRRADSLEAALRDLRGEHSLYAALKELVDLGNEPEYVEPVRWTEPLARAAAALVKAEGRDWNYD